MSPAEWLRFAMLCLLGGSLAWWLYRGRQVAADSAATLMVVAVLDAAQYVLTAQRATDPLTPLTSTLPGLLASAYGGLSGALFLLALAVGLALAVWRPGRAEAQEPAGLAPPPVRPRDDAQRQRGREIAASGWRANTSAGTSQQAGAGNPSSPSEGPRQLEVEISQPADASAGTGMEAEEGGRRVDTGGNEAADALGGTGRQAEERLRRPGADRTWTADASAGTGLRADERLRQGGGGKRAAGASGGRSRRGGRGLDGGRAALVGARLNGAIAGAGLGLLVLAGAATASAAPAVTDFANSGEIAMTPTLFIPRSALNTPNPYANDPQSAARGKVVFQENCQVCHGIAGDGNGPAGANLKIRPPTFHNPQHFLAPGMDGAHFWVISHGDGEPGGMPAWDGKLTAQQMWDVLNYIKTIAAGKPA